jgi:hypothetical protein
VTCLECGVDQPDTASEVERARRVAEDAVKRLILLCENIIPTGPEGFYAEVERMEADIRAMVAAEVAAAKREAIDALRHQIARNHEPSDACSPCSTGLRLVKRFIDGKEKA